MSLHFCFVSFKNIAQTRRFVNYILICMCCFICDLFWCETLEKIA